MGAGIMERLKHGPVLGDGGYLIELERRGYVRAGSWLPLVVLDYPQALLQLHTEFIRAGADVLQALTFFGNRHMLESHAKRGGDAELLNRKAVELARAAAGDEVLVAGTICTTGLVDSKYRPGPARQESKEALEKVRGDLREQVAWLADAGSDFLIAETFHRLDEALIAVEEGKSTGLPLVATVCFKGSPRTADGFGPADCARRLVGAGADVVGINCQRDGPHTLPLLHEMREAVDVPIAAQPLGLRTPDGWLDTSDPAVFERMQLSRQEWGEFATAAETAGVGYLGACCGTGPSGIRGMAEALGKPTWLTGRKTAGSNSDGNLHSRSGR